MNFDFSIVLVVSAAATGIIAVADRVFSRRAGRHPGGAREFVVSHAWSLLPILVSALLVRSFVFEPFRIPSASMMPGLQDGDFIFVNKFAYGLRLPVTNTQIIRTGVPHRGDVVVFRLPAKPAVHYIKRLIGLPGDHVVVHYNRVIINGQVAPLSMEGRYTGGFGFTGSRLATERLGAVPHVLMFDADLPAKNFDAIVPAGQYFFMGDNRNDSEDSRFADVGFVPGQNLVGPATRIWFNWRLPGWPSWRRIGVKII